MFQPHFTGLENAKHVYRSAALDNATAADRIKTKYRNVCETQFKGSPSTVFEHCTLSVHVPH